MITARAMAVGALWLVGCGRIGFEGVPSDPYAEAVIEDGPSAYWRLGEAMGTVAIDERGAHDGRYAGACQLGVDGIRQGDTAVRFDGTSCVIEIGDAFAFEGRLPFSIELWASVSVVNDTVRWLASRDTASGLQNGYQLAFQSSELWFERLFDSSGATYLKTAPPVVGRFQHVVLTFDGTTQRLYVDGAQSSAEDFPAPAPLASGTLVLGDRARVNSVKFAGVMDEVAIYEHALSPQRVAAHFAAR